MKRSRRIVFHLAAGLSLLLFLASSAAWLRGYWASDCFNLRFRKYDGTRTLYREATFYSGHGGVCLMWFYDTSASPGYLQLFKLRIQADPKALIYTKRDPTFLDNYPRQHGAPYSRYGVGFKEWR